MYSILPLMLAIALSSCSTRVEYPRSSELPFPNAIDINTATVEELEKLPHIGRATAAAITEFREKNGAFRRVEHLMLIRGISEQRFAELRPMVRVE